jgi:DNA polymerase III delta prime subunit
MQSTNYNVRYCLICNYISKLIDSLQSEFICVRFNQLPEDDIYNFIKIISNKENLQLTESIINTIQKTYKSDIRSMINFLQLNQNLTVWNNSIITKDIWEKIYNFHRTNNSDLREYIHEISINYNIDKKSIIVKYFNYIIRNKVQCILPNFLNNIQVIVHSDKTDLNTTIDYFCENFNSCYI